MTAGCYGRPVLSRRTMQRAHVECLESRTLMSATFDADGTLRIDGTSKNDRISVSTSANEVGVLAVKVNAAEQTFALAPVVRLRISGGRGNDSIVVRDLPFSTRIYGGPDNDSISGAMLENRIYGGSGNDTIGGG